MNYVIIWTWAVVMIVVGFLISPVIGMLALTFLGFGLIAIASDSRLGQKPLPEVDLKEGEKPLHRVPEPTRGFTLFMKTLFVVCILVFLSGSAMPWWVVMPAGPGLFISGTWLWNQSNP